MQKRGGLQTAKHSTKHISGHVSDVEKELIHVKLEKLRLDRERSVLILNFGIVIYFIFLVLSLLGYINQFLSVFFLNIIIVGAILILIVSVFPYARAMKTEEDEMLQLIDSLTKRQ